MGHCGGTDGGDVGGERGDIAVICVDCFCMFACEADAGGGGASLEDYGCALGGWMRLGVGVAAVVVAVEVDFVDFGGVVGHFGVDLEF